MEHDFGFPLNMPPYEKYSPNVGRMSGMLPGLFENGGVYCHPTGFKILMDCKLGRAEKALCTLKKIMPAPSHMYLQTAIPHIRNITANLTGPGQPEPLHGA